MEPGLYNFTELMQVQLWRRLGSATVEADVMLHSGFMSRAGDSVLIMGYMISQFFHVFLKELIDSSTFGHGRKPQVATGSVWSSACALGALKFGRLGRV